MAFLDNSGDIILDAVLTDTGRMRLAKGNGTFKIVKFALGDDEIDYSLFNKSHASGSAYYDLEIMQTPVLEAFTNNTSLLKHKLLSMPQTNLLYLPRVKLDDISQPAAVIGYNSGTTVVNAYAPTAAASTGIAATTGTGIYLMAADENTTLELTKSALVNGNSHAGFLSATSTFSKHIRVEQGLDTLDISFRKPIGELKETQYIIQLDNRLAKLTDTAITKAAAVSYIDDDQVASYYLSLGKDGEYVKELAVPTGDSDPDAIIKGPKGTLVEFKLLPSDDIETSTALFNEIGGGAASNITINSQTYYYIDSNVRVTGATTGSSIDIPVRFMKHYTTP